MTRADVGGLALMMGLFLAAHLPGIFREGAGLDEDLYAVPGLTMAKSGVPRIPYIPARDPRTIYDHADVALYTLPPLGFVAEVPFFLALPPGVGPARLASVAAGLAAVAVVFALAKRWVGSRRAALFAAAAYLFSRTFLFPALTARPDMLAAGLGLLAVWWIARPAEIANPRRVVLSGLSAGLSLLAHPFGVVPCFQIGLRLTCSGGTWPGRVGRLLRFGLAVLAAFALWLPWIALHPDLFRHQFGGNVLGRAGPGLGATLLNPWPVLAFQSAQIVERAGLAMCGLAVVGTLRIGARLWSKNGGSLRFLPASSWGRAGWGVARPADTPRLHGGRPPALTLPHEEAGDQPPAAGGNHGRDEGDRELAYHLIAATLLLILFMGRHPLLGYFVYPAGFAAVAVGGLLDALARRIGGRVGTIAAWVLLVLALLPGSGLRRAWAQHRHRGDPAYDHRAVARSIMTDLPADTLAAVDGPFVLEFYLAGRPTIDALYLEFLPLDFEFVILGREGIKRARIEADDLILLKTYGSRDDPFASYAELYRRKPGAPVWHDPPLEKLPPSP